MRIPVSSRPESRHFWRCWVNSMIFAGIDVGSVAAKAVLINSIPDNREITPVSGTLKAEILAAVTIPTGWSPRDAGKAAFNSVLEREGITRNDVSGIVGTGYGRIALDFIDRAVTEITCHALGASCFFPENNLVVDIGGQDSKAILVNSSGKVLNFVMNDKCAAGTGRFLQVMAVTLGLEIDQLKEISPDEPVPINSMCTVFAESEVVSLLASGETKERIISGLYHSIAKRMSSMTGSMGTVRGITFTGGVAKIPGMQAALSKTLGCSVSVPTEPQIIGALGAALVACNSKN